MPMLRQEDLLTHGLKKPSEFSREGFIELGVKVHRECGIDVVEAICFLEPHEDGQPHMNLLVRSSRQFRWLPVAQRYLAQYKVHVNFAPHIKTWMDGCVYGRVPSEHKGQERLDQHYRQWAKEGTPTPLEQFLPKRFLEPGFSRQTRLSSLSFFDLCVKHGIKTETELWAKATALSEQGDRAMLAYCLDNDGERQLGKVLQALAAKERARRMSLTREGLLEEAVAKTACKCSSPGQCHGLMKQLLQRNNLDGEFQKAVLGAMRTGRMKRRNICLIGGADCGKSFLFKGLRELFYTYERPDSGTHQLEDLLDKEVVFLNDFEYDSSSKDWMAWWYLKGFLEGGDVTVSRPKNKGGNKQFTGDAPVFMTAPSEVKLFRYGVEVVKETQQMRKRIRYLEFNYQLREEEQHEVGKVCGHCTAKLYLEGKPLLDAPAGQLQEEEDSEEEPQMQRQEAGEPLVKRRRTVQECVAELGQLHTLLQQGALSQEEFSDLKSRLLNGD